jgi:hypothetical protein
MKLLNTQITNLALRYYGTEDLSKLLPYQLDKLTNWATNTNPNTQAKQKGNKYSGNTYSKLKKIY